MSHQGVHTMHKIKLAHGGQIVIPEAMLQKLNLKDGDELICEEHNGAMFLATRRAEIDRARTLFREWFPPIPGRSAVDELLAERREEAAKEEQEAQDELNGKYRGT